MRAPARAPETRERAGHGARFADASSHGGAGGWSLSFAGVPLAGLSGTIAPHERAPPGAPGPRPAPSAAAELGASGAAPGRLLVVLIVGNVIMVQNFSTTIFARLFAPFCDGRVADSGKALVGAWRMIGPPQGPPERQGRPRRPPETRHFVEPGPAPVGYYQPQP